MQGNHDIGRGKLESAGARVVMLPVRPAAAAASIRVAVPLRFRILWGVVALGGAGLVAWMSAERLESGSLRGAVAAVGCIYVALGLFGLVRSELCIPLALALRGSASSEASADAEVLPFPRRLPEP
ncbi:MAG: hypothetical protein QM765_16305 [Myxococcales bacterium]